MKQKWYLLIVCLLSCVAVCAQGDNPLWSIDNLKISLESDNSDDDKIVIDNNSFNIPENWNEGKVVFQFDMKKIRPAAENEDSIQPAQIWYQLNGANATATDIAPIFKSADEKKDTTWSVSTTINISVDQMTIDKDNTFGLCLSDNGTFKEVPEVVHVWSLPRNPVLSLNSDKTFVGREIVLKIDDFASSDFTSEYSINGSIVNNKRKIVKAEDIGTELSKEENYILNYKYAFGDKIWKEGVLPATKLTVYHLPVYTPEIIVNDNPNDTHNNQGSTISHTVMATDKVSLSYKTEYGYEKANNLINEWKSKDSSFVAQNALTNSVVIRNYINKEIYDEQTLTYEISVRPLPDVKFRHIKADEASYLFAPSTGTKVSVDLENNQDDLNWGYEWCIANEETFSTGREAEIPMEKLPIGDNTLKVSVTCRRGNLEKTYVKKTLTHIIKVVSLPKATVDNEEDKGLTDILTCDGQHANVVIKPEGGYADGFYFYIESKEGGEYGTSLENEGGKYTIYYRNETDKPVSSVFNFAGKNTIPEAKSTIEGGQVQNVSFLDNGTFKATVYPHPKMLFKKELLANYYYGSEVNQIVDTVYTMPSEWTIEWSLNNDILHSDKKDDNTFIVPDGGDFAQVPMTLYVKASNMYKGKVWGGITLTHSFTAWHRAKLDGIGLITQDNDNNNIYEGHTFNLSAMTQYGYPEGWKYSWRRDDNDQVISTKGSDEFLAKFYGDGGSETQTYKLHVENRIPGLDEGNALLFQDDASLSLTIWRKAENYTAGSDASIIKITDTENGAIIDNRIREGRELKLEVPQAKYGYKNKWIYTWNGTNTDSHQTLLSIPNIQTDDEAMKTESRTISLTITNMGQNGLPWEENSMQKSYTVYRMPKTPTKLAFKGSGVSRTLIATMAIVDQQLQDNDYYLCFAHRESTGAVKLIGEPMKQEGPGKTRFSAQIPEDLWNDRNNLCVFSMWHYSDGTWITSGLRFIDEVDENWDGSDYSGRNTYSGITRGGDTTDIQNADVSSQSIQDAYGISGTVRGKLQRGLNIVRMADGTVRKVIMK